MRVVSIGDLVLDYYYKNNKLVGVSGGMTSHNIIANLAKHNINTAVFGVCGNDDMEYVCKKSLEDLKVNIDNVVTLDNVNTRCFHVSYNDEDNKKVFTSKASIISSIIGIVIISDTWTAVNPRLNR